MLRWVMVCARVAEAVPTQGSGRKLRTANETIAAGVDATIALVVDLAHSV